MRIQLTAVKPPCRQDCPARAWDCHVQGKCAAYDAFARACAELREKRRLIKEADMALEEGITRRGQRERRG